MKKLLVTLSVSVLALSGATFAKAQLVYEPFRFITLAGHAIFLGDADGTGAAAQFRKPSGAAADGAGNVYVADTENHTIRKVTPGGGVTTLAGLAGTAGSADDTGSAARFFLPNGVAVDGTGNVYVADTYNQTIRKLSPAGVVTTLAGMAGVIGSTNGSGSTARFSSPAGVAVDTANNVYVADTGNHTIRKITPAGTVSTLAGLAGSTGSADGTGEAAQFKSPQAVALDSANNVYVADTGNFTIRKITPGGEVTTLAGFPGAFSTTDGNGSAARFYFPLGVAVDAANNVYVTDNYYGANGTIRKITPTGDVTTLAGIAGLSGSADGNGSAARFVSPYGLAADSTGNLYVTDNNASTVRKITPTADVTTLAGTAGVGALDGTGGAARFNRPSGVAVDAANNVYVGDSQNHTIRKLTPAGAVTTLAGSAGNLGNLNGAGSLARFNAPAGLAVDSGGNIYVAEPGNGIIRKVTPEGTVSTYAAAGSYPTAVAVDGATNVYVAGNYSCTIHKITPAGVMTNLAGQSGTAGNADGIGSAARFSYPRGVAVDALTNVYVADTGNSTIRKITPNGTVSTLAGLAGVTGAIDGAGNAARFSSPTSVAVDGAGNLYVTDIGYANSTVRKITPAGVVTTLGGSAFGWGSADGIGAAARFFEPNGVAVDSFGKVYVADTGNHTIRTMVPTLILAPVSPGNNAALYLGAFLGQQYRFDYKNTLSAPTWTPLTTVSVTTGSLQFTDPQSADIPGRFYRAVLLP